jgi:ribosomal protein S18 acetylase RimI-like enzyme
VKTTSESPATVIEIRINPHPPLPEFSALWSAAWGAPLTGDTAAMWKLSLFHLGAYEGDRLVGYVNVAHDGSGHAFLLDPTVHPDFQRKGIGSRLVTEAAKLARERGGQWLHVDYEPHLEAFYASCGFRPTKAGLIRL